MLGRARWDAAVPPPWRTATLLPGARSALICGCGGRSFGAAFARAPEARDGAPDPVDRFTRRAVEAALPAAGACAVFYWERRGGAFLDLVALGEACGLGVPSRLGLLLHPRLGPWLSIRAAVLTEVELAPTMALAGFAPCAACEGFCRAACPGRAPGPAGFDVAACAGATRRIPACRERCDARRACPIGREHAPDAALERRQRVAAAARLLA